MGYNVDFALNFVFLSVIEFHNVWKSEEITLRNDL